MTDAILPRLRMRPQLLELFESLGPDFESRKSRMTKIMTALYTKMYADVLIGFFFEKHELNHLVSQQIAFFLNAAGLADSFEGRGPATAHVKLAPILSGHFDRRITLLKETLDETDLTQKQKETWINYESAFRAIIVRG